jgi:hypothetical protein
MRKDWEGKQIDMMLKIDEERTSRWKKEAKLNVYCLHVSNIYSWNEKAELINKERSEISNDSSY